MATVWRGLGCALMLHLVTVGVGLAGEEGTSSRNGTPRIAPKRHSLKELRDQHVVKQQRDYSCGAAALATLMTYYFGEETSEQEILRLLEAQLTQEEKRAKLLRGYSLLDLRRVAQAKGYQTAGFTLTLKQLQHLAAPVIVFIQPLGYKHFAVLRGIDRGRVFLSDPARGNLRVSIERFMSEWDGSVFILGKPGEEEIASYPLALPRPDHVQPELLRMGRTLDLGAPMTDLVVRSRSR